jgi:FkbM family methyltransferase
MLERAILKFRVARVLSTIWDITWKGALRIVSGEHYKRTGGIIRIKKIIRLGTRLFYVRRVGKDIVQTRLPDGTILQPIDNMGQIIWEIYTEQTMDRFYRYRDDDIVVDVGAHVGLFTLKAAKNVRSGIVIAIEPNPSNYELLLKNIASNKMKNVKSLNVALADFNGNTELYLAEESGMHSMAIRRSSKYITVQARTLDQLVNELKLKKVNFIKIDVEGSAFTVLKGAEKTLRNNDLFIVASCGHTPQELPNVLRYLSDNGFKITVGPRKDIYASKKVIGKPPSATST